MVPNLQQEGLLHLQAIDYFPKVMKGVLHELKCVAITPPHTHTHLALVEPGSSTVPAADLAQVKSCHDWQLNGNSGRELNNPLEGQINHSVQKLPTRPHLLKSSSPPNNTMLGTKALNTRAFGGDT